MKYKLANTSIRIEQDVTHFSKCPADWKTAAIKEGPWDDEPDLIFFMIDNYPCFILRRYPFHSLCGYIGLAEQYLGSIDALQVHGGIT